MDPKLVAVIMAHEALSPLAKDDRRRVNKAVKVLFGEEPDAPPAQDVRQLTLVASQPAAIVLVEEPVTSASQPAAKYPKAPPSREKQQSRDLSELAEIILDALEKSGEKGLTPRALGAAIKIPGKPASSRMPNHQYYQFRKCTQELVSDGRIARVNEKDPKKKHFVTSCFAPEKPSSSS